MREPVYRQAPLTPATWEELQRHPQFELNEIAVPSQNRTIRSVG